MRHNPRAAQNIDLQMALEDPVDRSLELRAVRPSASEIFKSSAELNKASVAFLKVDLETALSFARSALESSDDDKKRARNQHNARTAYDTVLRLMPKVTPSRADAEIIQDKLNLLKSELMKLGERF